MFGAYNNPDPRNFSAFNPAMPPHPSAIGMNPHSSWHMNQNYYTPQPLPSYYPPTPGMNYHNTFHGSPFDYQPTPYGGQSYPMHGPPMMDPYYDGMYKEPSMFDSCCPPRNPYDDHMVPPYKPQHSMRQSKPDQYHRQESVNNQSQPQPQPQSQSQSRSQAQQNLSSSQSLTRQQTQQHQRY